MIALAFFAVGMVGIVTFALAIVALAEVTCRLSGRS